MSNRIRVGVVGCGLIAQVMHLHYLRELSELFEIAAICDLSEDVRSACAHEYAVPNSYATWQELVAQDLDAVLVLTSGSHAPIAITAMDSGMHVLVEKPMCFSIDEGRAMIETANRTGRTLMVAYNKRYDAAYLRLQQEADALRDLRLVRVTTLESPLAPYVAHYPLQAAAQLPAEVLSVLKADNASRIEAAIGPTDDLTRRTYHAVLLDSLVHEFNAVRGVLGEPDQLEYADIRETGLTAILRYGEAQCIIAWVDLPGIARYEMEFAFYSPDRRLTLSFPSPFLRSMPTLLSIEAGDERTARSWRTEEITSFEESFKQELRHFHECVTTGRQPVTTAADALADVALCEAVVSAHLKGAPVDRPTQFEHSLSNAG